MPLFVTIKVLEGDEMTKIKEYLQDKKIIIIVCAMIIFTVMMPFLQKGMVIGDDYEYHLTRIQSMVDAMKTGVFPVKIHPQMANSYGYGSGLFYPNLFLYIPAIMGLIGIDILIAYKIFIALMLLLMFVLLYFSIKNITDDTQSALVGTIIIMLSKCLSLHLLHRFALGEFLGFIFIVPVISGMYDYIYNEYKKPYWLFIGFFGLINSHLITTLICTAYCVFVFFINIKSSIKNPKKVLKLVVTALAVALVTISFWAPMLEQMVKGEYKYSKPWTNMANDEYSMYDLFATEKYSIGIFITISIPIILYSLFDKKISKKTKKFAISFIIMALLVTNFSIWKITKDFTNIIQFKWRLVGILTAIAGITLALLLKEYGYKNEIKMEHILVVILLLNMYLFTQYYVSSYNNPIIIKEQEKVESKIYSMWNSIGGGSEYLPVETELNVLYNPNHAIVVAKEKELADKEKIEIIKTGLRAQFEKTEKEQTSFEMPFIYYYGYVANIIDENGIATPLMVEKSENGLVKITTDENIGTVHVWYNGTRIQKLSYIISAVSYVAITVYAIYIIKKKMVIKENIAK